MKRVLKNPERHLIILSSVGSAGVREWKLLLVKQQWYREIGKGWTPHFYTHTSIHTHTHMLAPFNMLGKVTPPQLSFLGN